MLRKFQYEIKIIFSSLILELQADFKEIQNGLLFFTKYGFGPTFRKNYNPACYLNQLPIPTIDAALTIF